jgi:TetR/AcrR family transcriptional regulator
MSSWLCELGRVGVERRRVADMTRRLGDEMKRKVAVKTRKSAPPASGGSPKRSRDPVRSKAAILETAIQEFCQHGYSGARIERIARGSNSNMRMIYHYFGNKEGLYLAVLESAYLRIREQEKKLDLVHAEPVEGIRTLIRFTFDFFRSNKDVLALINHENTLKGRFLRKLPTVRKMTPPLVAAIGDLLKRGHRQGHFRGSVDAIQFYVSLVALSQLHILNRYTLSTIFNKDLSAAGWIAERRSHIENILMSYLRKQD